MSTDEHDDEALRRRVEALQAENRALTAQLTEARRRNGRPTGVTTMTWGVRTILGRSFNRAGRNLSEAAAQWQRGDREKMPLPETVDFLTAAFARFVRVGLFGLIFAILPAAVLIIQTVLLVFQNAKLDTQNRLAREQVVAALVEQREMVIRESSELSILMGGLHEQRAICPELRAMGSGLGQKDATGDPVADLANEAMDLLPTVNRRKMGQKVAGMKEYYRTSRIELASRCNTPDAAMAPLEGLLEAQGGKAINRYAATHYESLCGALEAVQSACQSRQQRLTHIREDLDRRHRTISDLLMEEASDG